MFGMTMVERTSIHNEGSKLTVSTVNCALYHHESKPSNNSEGLADLLGGNSGAVSDDGTESDLREGRLELV